MKNSPLLQRVGARLKQQDSITPETKRPTPVSPAQVMQMQAAPEMKTGSTRVSTAFVPVEARRLKEKKRDCTIL